MSELANKNHEFIAQAFPGIWEHYSARLDFLSDSPSEEFTVSVGPTEAETLHCPLNHSYMNKFYNEQFENLPEAHGVLVWGVERIESFSAVLNNLEAGKLLILVVFEPEILDKLFGEYDFTELSNKYELKLIYERSVPDIILEVSSIVGQYEKKCNQILPLVAPGKFPKMLGEGNAIRNWITLVLKYPFYNQSRKEIKSANSKIDYVKPFQRYPIRKFTQILDLLLISSPGIRDFYRKRKENGQGELGPLTISYLTWNRWEVFSTSLSSLLRQGIPEDTTVRVIDNHSQDETPKEMRKYAQKFQFLDYVRLDKNYGAPGGMHEGYLRVENDIVIFLDNDVMVESGCDDWIEPLIDPFRHHPRVGAVAPWGVTFTSDVSGDWMMKVWLPGITVPVARYCGFCLAFRKRALDDIGGFNPELFGRWGGADHVIPWLLREEGWITVAPPAQPIVYPIPYDEEHYDYDRSDEFKTGWGSKENLRVKSRRVLNTAKNNRTLDD